MGARKFVLMALYPNGCSPMARARNPNATGCIQILNDAAQLFNTNLRTLVDSPTLQMPDSTIVIVNAYKIIMDILQNPTPYGQSLYAIHFNRIHSLRMNERNETTFLTK